MRDLRKKEEKRLSCKVDFPILPQRDMQFLRSSAYAMTKYPYVNQGTAAKGTVRRT